MVFSITSQFYLVKEDELKFQIEMLRFQQRYSANDMYPRTARAISNNKLDIVSINSVSRLNQACRHFQSITLMQSLTTIRQISIQ